MLTLVFIRLTRAKNRHGAERQGPSLASPQTTMYRDAVRFAGPPPPRDLSPSLACPPQYSRPSGSGRPAGGSGVADVLERVTPILDELSDDASSGRSRRPRHILQASLGASSVARLQVKLTLLDDVVFVRPPSTGHGPHADPGQCVSPVQLSPGWKLSPCPLAEDFLPAGPSARPRVDLLSRAESI